MTTTQYYSNIMDKAKKGELPKFETIGVPEFAGCEPEIKLEKINGRNFPFYSALMFIMNAYRNIRLENCPSLVTIASSGSLSLYITTNTLARYVRKMVDIGLLSVYDKRYCSSIGRSKIYVWYPENEKKIYAYLKEKGVTPFTYQINGEIIDIECDKVPLDAIRFSSYVRFRKPANLTKLEMKALIDTTLDKRYPLLKTFQKKINEINTKYYEKKPERRLNYQPKVGFSKGGRNVSGIGIRYNCRFCSYPKHKSEYGIGRENYLNENKLNLHYDVKGSVPKISSLLNFGVWSDNSNDPYKDLAIEYGKDSGDMFKEWTKGERNAAKKFFVRLYFDQSIDAGCNHINRSLKERGHRANKTHLKNYVEKFYKAVTKCFGKSYGGEIFFHESNVYILALEKMLADGYDVVTCYDSFYAAKRGVSSVEFNRYMDKLIEDCAMEYLAMLRDSEMERCEWLKAA